MEDDNNIIDVVIKLIFWGLFIVLPSLCWFDLYPIATVITDLIILVLIIGV